jgi:hypothetical protein
LTLPALFVIAIYRPYFFQIIPVSTMEVHMAAIPAVKNRLIGASCALFGIFLFAPALAPAAVIESWENPLDPLDGWTSPANWSASSDHTIGVTNGSQSLHMTSPDNSSPNYSPMLASPSTQLNTIEIASAFILIWDVTNVFVPAGAATGGFQQWDLDINNADTGFVSLTGFSYPAATLPFSTAASPLTYEFAVTVPTSLRVALATSLNPTQFIFQVGGGSTSGNDQFWIDNFNTGEIPEPAAFSLLGIGTLSLLGRRRNC